MKAVRRNQGKAHIQLNANQVITTQVGNTKNLINVIEVAMIEKLMEDILTIQIHNIENGAIDQALSMKMEIMNLT
jgi:hypothetical protein